MDAPYFPFYPADWLSDDSVQALTLEEAGAYITLLSYMWNGGKDCSVIDDDKHLAKLLHVSTKKWTALRKVLVDGPGAVFYRTDDGRLRNSRLQREWQKATEKIAQNAANANKRWGKQKESPSQSVGNANAMQTHMRNDAISDSDTDPDTDQKKDDDERTRVPERNLVEGVSGAGTSPTVNPYDEIESVMRVKMVKPNYILKTTEYQSAKDLLEKGIPLDFIVEAVGFAFEHKQSRGGGKIQSFAYCVPVIERLWEAQTAKTQFSAEIQVAATRSRDGPKKQRDERYAAFYRLFPDA